MNDVLGQWIPPDEDRDCASELVSTLDDANANAILLPCSRCRRAYYFTAPAYPPMCAWCQQRRGQEIS